MLGVTGVDAVGADEEATLFGGLGSEGKNCSGPPFDIVPFAVGDPNRKKKKKEVKNFLLIFLFDTIWHHNHLA